MDFSGTLAKPVNDYQLGFHDLMFTGPKDLQMRILNFVWSRKVLKWMTFSQIHKGI